MGSIAALPRRGMCNYLGCIARFPWGKLSNSLGGIVSFLRRRENNCLGRIAYFLRRKRSTGLRGLAYWAVSFLGRKEMPSWGVLLPSLGGRGAPAWLLPAKLLLVVLLLLPLLLLGDQVIFPSFLLTKFWNFSICLVLTLLNLISLTLSMKAWHSLSLSAEMVAASWDLTSSFCMVTLVKMLLMLLILAWINSFSAFLNFFSGSICI